MTVSSKILGVISAVYLGAYDKDRVAARAYDLAAFKNWGPGTLIIFPVSDYARNNNEMQSVSIEGYLASLRGKSSGFSRVFQEKDLQIAIVQAHKIIMSRGPIFQD